MSLRPFAFSVDWSHLEQLVREPHPELAEALAPRESDDDPVERAVASVMRRVLERSFERGMDAKLLDEDEVIQIAACRLARRAARRAVRVNENGTVWSKV